MATAQMIPDVKGGKISGKNRGQREREKERGVVCAR